MKKGVVWKDKLWILTAPVHSGKTSFLSKWTGGRNVSGFLTPDVEGVRVLYDLSNKTTIPFETIQLDYQKIISVGKYSFLRSTFDYGNTLIVNSIKERNKYFIIDEVGKLEMNDQGFESGIQFLLNHLRNNNSPTIYILVVRDFLLDGFISKYNLPYPALEEIDATF